MIVRDRLHSQPSEYTYELPAYSVGAGCDVVYVSGNVPPGIKGST